jgi:hypothetical protein
VSLRPVLIRPQLFRCRSGPSDEGGQKLSTSGGSTSGKSSALGVIHGDGTEVRRWSTYKQGESRRGEER